MSSWQMKVYHRLPASLRSAAASLRGFYLRSWRYGADTERLVGEALERERWSEAQWRQWQQERLAFVLQRAATQVPYYRDYWEERRRRGDRASWENLENWPILEKEPLRANPRAFVADDCDPARMFHEHTSGTTGKSLDLWCSQKTVRAWYALFEARGRLWHGVDRHARWGILGGQMIAPVGQRQPPFWVWNAGLKQLYLSSYHLAPDLISHYIEAIRRYRVSYLLGYTSALYALAQGVLLLGRRDLQMRVAITNAEPLYEYQRQTIEVAFNCRVRETYGMAEIVAAAGECEAGRMHLWPEAGWIEALDNGRPAEPGTPGDLVCTGLLNADMPLVRYRVGDRGVLPAESETCGCGRTLPLLASIEGRIDDVLYTRDGRAIGRLDPVFKSDLPVREAQIIQETLDQVRVRYVPAPEYTPATGEAIVARLRERLGPMKVVLEPLAEVPRTANGKFRAVICKLSPEERKLAQQGRLRTASI